MGTLLRRACFAAVVLGVLAYGAGHAGAQSSTDAYRAQLQAQLDQLEKQIAQQQGILDDAKSHDVSLQRDVDILNAQIAQAQLSIQARTLVIRQLTDGIQEKQNTIFGLNTQLNGELDSLGSMLRQKSELESTSLVVAALSSQSLSEFFSDLDSFDQINAQLQQSFEKIQTDKKLTQQQQDELQTQLEEETQLRQVQQLQQDQIRQQQTQKQKILADTKGQEKAYAALISANQKSAAQLRSALFQLTGSAAIPFSKALDYANEAEKQTGIRPAFLLAIIKEESDLGTNVGTGTWTVDMKAPRDTVPFKAITASLGLNPDTMPVSAKPWYGYGGAMGPAQFIPSTWVLYAGYVGSDLHYDSSRDRIGRLTGNKPPNPWVPEDAFMAAALYLGVDDGAKAQTPTSEFKAAMCYLAGCGNVGNKSLWFYGNQVLCNELEFQKDIDTITGSNDAPAMQNNTLYYGQC